MNCQNCAQAKNENKFSSENEKKLRKLWNGFIKLEYDYVKLVENLIEPELKNFAQEKHQSIIYWINI